MVKRIKIMALESGAKAIAELLEEEAPRTCEALWKCLESPMEVKGIQAMWVGRELMFMMPEENQKVDPTTIPTENSVVYPLPGDVFWIYYAAHVVPNPFGTYPRGKPIWDFFIIYGPDAMLGHGVCNWARIVEGLEDLGREAERIREEGTRLFRVGRLEG